MHYCTDNLALVFIPRNGDFLQREPSTLRLRIKRATSSIFPCLVEWGCVTRPDGALDGSWKRVVTKAEAGSSGPPGIWRLTVSAVGWRLRDPRGHGALVDVAYLSAGLLEARGGIATTDRSPQEGNIWCTEPFQPVRYHWAVKSSLIITLAGPKRCDGQSGVWAGVWTHT